MTLHIKHGNTVYLRIIPLIDEKEYKLLEGDRVIYTVRRGARDDPVIRKVLTLDNYNASGELVLMLSPAETELPTGDYKYDCSIEMSSGERYTFIPPNDFIVCEIVTDWGDSCYD